MFRRCEKTGILDFSEPLKNKIKIIQSLVLLDWKAHAIFISSKVELFFIIWDRLWSNVQIYSEISKIETKKE